MIKIRTIVLFLCVLNVVMFCGCFQSADNDESLSGIPAFVVLTIKGDWPGGIVTDSLSSARRYQTFQWFDLSKLEGVGKATDTPFVYVRRNRDIMIVRPSNDINNPYFLKNHGMYWHCKWMSDDRGDSMMVDRFLCNNIIYEYIQRLKADGKINQDLIEINTFDPDCQNTNRKWTMVKYDFGSVEEFDRNAGEHFNELIALRDDMRNRRSNGSDSIAGRISDVIMLMVNKRGHRAPMCVLYGDEYSVNYGESPMGLFDERRDIERPYFIRRIK